MTVLVCGHPQEDPVAMLLESLRTRKTDCVLIDQLQVGENVQVRWQLTAGRFTGHLRVGNRTIDLHEISSVFHRFIDIGGNGPGEKTATERRAVSAIQAISDLLDIIPAKVINPRRAMMSNNSKPYQAHLILRAGFSIPDTFVTNDPLELIRRAEMEGPLIFKSLSSVRSIVSPLNDLSDRKLFELRSLPTQFQKQIHGYNVRVHVVGSELIATRIRSQSTDYRYPSDNDQVSHQPFELNDELHHKCVKLARICGLHFAGIDLMISDDKVFCLEVNPSPAYSYFQRMSGQPISDILADYMTDGVENPGVTQ